MLARIILILVDAEDDSDVLVLGGRRDDDLLDRAAQVLLGSIGIGEMARGLDDDLSPDRFPVNCRRVSLRENAKLIRADFDAILCGVILFKIAGTESY